MAGCLVAGASAPIPGRQARGYRPRTCDAALPGRDASAGGYTVLDVPAKLSAQVRVFATGNGRKTDPVDAHSVALAALRSPKMVTVEVSPDLVVLGLLADRRDELGRARTQTINRIRRLLLELLPGGAKKFLSAAQARALIQLSGRATSPGRPRWKLCAASLDGCPTSSTGRCSTTRPATRQRAREGTRGRH